MGGRVRKAVGMDDISRERGRRGTDAAKTARPLAFLCGRDVSRLQ